VPAQLDDRGVQRQRRRDPRTAREQGDPRFSEVSSRIFGTPHDIDVGGLCRAYHIEYRQAEADELAAVLDEPFSGVRVEVKADRSTLRRLHAAIKAAL
jgi:2-succinyl-5-enolpyruvyl-6-hydroxy-3-cyclohexene-1-carboxylate synthase